MNYYEELGLERDASEKSIRNAHRALSKILHPDQQTDPMLRRVAEIQMCRVNAIVETLLDPKLRRRYDESIAAKAPGPSTHRPARGRFRLIGSPVALAGTVIAAVLLSLASIWIFAGDLMYFQAPVVNRPAASMADVDGRWVYTTPGPEAHHEELRVTYDGSGVRGRYMAIDDRHQGIASRVAFDFAGPSNWQNEFPWSAKDGSGGLIDLKVLSPKSLLVEWRVTRFGSHAVPRAGGAIFTRE
jgi:hypothetical protein